MKIARWFLLLLPCTLLAQSREDPQLAAKAEAMPPSLQWIRVDHDRQESIIERTLPFKDLDGRWRAESQKFVPRRRRSLRAADWNGPEISRCLSGSAPAAAGSRPLGHARRGK